MNWRTGLCYLRLGKAWEKAVQEGYLHQVLLWGRGNGGGNKSGSHQLWNGCIFSPMQWGQYLSSLSTFLQVLKIFPEHLSPSYVTAPLGFICIFIFSVTSVEWHCQMPESIVFPGQLLPDFLHNCDSLKASLPAWFCQLRHSCQQNF